MPTHSNTPFQKITCFIEGKKLDYDFCSSEPLEKAKEYAKEYNFSDYIGPTKIYYVNDEKNEDKELHHYFRKNEKISDRQVILSLSEIIKLIKFPIMQTEKGKLILDRVKILIQDINNYIDLQIKDL